METRETVLLVGRTRMVMEEVHKKISVENVDLVMAINLDEVKAAFNNATISTVFVGAGIELETRLDIVRHIFQASTFATVHMKNEDTGPQGMIPFVNSVLR